MNSNREYIYSFPNTSCTIRAIAYLRNMDRAYLGSVTVINSLDYWLVKFSIVHSTPYRLTKNLQAFLDEMGFVSIPSAKIQQAIVSLDGGESPTVVMNRYRVVIVTHGKPETEEIEIFRDRVVDGLGYCPQNMM